MTPWNSIQSMEFCQPEYWSRFPSPEDLPNPGIEPRSPALQMDSLPAGEPKNAGVGSSSLLQQISPTQESNQDLLHHRHSSPPELPISCIVSTVYKCGPQSPNLSHPPFPPWRPHVCPPTVSLLTGHNFSHLSSLPIILFRSALLCIWLLSSHLLPLSTLPHRSSSEFLSLRTCCSQCCPLVNRNQSPKEQTSSKSIPAFCCARVIVLLTNSPGPC